MEALDPAGPQEILGTLLASLEWKPSFLITSILADVLIHFCFLVHKEGTPRCTLSTELPNYEGPPLGVELRGKEAARRARDPGSILSTMMQTHRHTCTQRKPSLRPPPNGSPDPFICSWWGESSWEA